jgi:hypothetical protein
MKVAASSLEPWKKAKLRSQGPSVDEIIVRPYGEEEIAVTQMGCSSKHSVIHMMHSKQQNTDTERHFLQQSSENQNIMK